MGDEVIHELRVLLYSFLNYCYTICIVLDSACPKRLNSSCEDVNLWS
jgi:hypothetical protein